MGPECCRATIACCASWSSARRCHAIRRVSGTVTPEYKAYEVHGRRHAEGAVDDSLGQQPRDGLSRDASFCFGVAHLEGRPSQPAHHGGSGCGRTVAGGLDATSRPFRLVLAARRVMAVTRRDENAGDPRRSTPGPRRPVGVVIVVRPGRLNADPCRVHCDRASVSTRGGRPLHGRVVLPPERIDVGYQGWARSRATTTIDRGCVRLRTFVRPSEGVLN